MTKLFNNRLFKYFAEAKQELEKVTWPTQREVSRYSLVVIIISVVVGLYFGLADWVFDRILSILVSLTA